MIGIDFSPWKNIERAVVTSPKEYAASAVMSAKDMAFKSLMYLRHNMNGRILMIYIIGKVDLPEGE